MFNKKVRVTLIGSLLMALLAVSGQASAASTGVTTLVSRHTNGAYGNMDSEAHHMTPDGRYVTFSGASNNLVDNDTNSLADVFVHDRDTGVTTRVSLATDGTQGNSGSGGSHISPDGRYVAFYSDAMNLVPGDEQFYGDLDVFIHDRQTGETTMWIPSHTDGTPANEDGHSLPIWTSDMRYIVFASTASNLVDDDTNGEVTPLVTDVFVHDTQTGETTMVSRHSDGTQGDDASYEADISDDGRYVTFVSDADNLVDVTVGNTQNVYIHDRQTGITTLASRHSDGTPADDYSHNSSISADGRYVAFQSDADNLVAIDSDFLNDIFIHDRVTGQTITASQNELSGPGDADNIHPNISADGRYVVFSAYSILTADDDNVYADIIVYDRVLNSWKLISHHSDGTPTNDESERPVISGDGQVIAYLSWADNLVDNDTNSSVDISVHELVAPSAPTAAFTASPLAGPAPLAVNFTDQSAGSPTSWAWAFGDGGTSTQRHPSHTYTTPGTYTVSLTATNANGSDGETKTAYITVTTPPPTPSLYVAPATAGTVGGVAATPQDVLFRDGTAGTWAMHFDGSDVGVTKAIVAFARLSNGDLLLVLKANQSLPGVGAVTPWDVVRFAPSSTGNNTAGTFAWYVDGSDVGLTTAAEKIDALDLLPDGRLLVSTGGGLSAPKTGGGTLKTQDEDLATLTATALGATTAGTWALYFDGTAVPGLAAEDVAGAHMVGPGGDIYVNITGAFNVGGVGGNGKDVLKLTPAGGGYTVTMYWRGGNNGFNLNLGGIEFP